MHKELNYYWRVFGTGLSFAAFGLGGMLLGLVVFPLLRLVPGDKEKRSTQARLIIRFAFRVFVRLMEALGLIRVDVEGLEKLKLKQPSLVLANHPTLIDVVLLLALLPPMDCVVKRSLWGNIFVGGIMRGADYIPNDNSQEFIDTCIERLLKGNSLVIFPEGTRSIDGKLNKFQRGAATIAIKSGCQVLPVIMGCDPPTLMKGQKWYEIPPRTAELRIRVCNAIDITSVLRESRNESISRRKVALFLQEFFEGQVEYEQLRAAGA